MVRQTRWLPHCRAFSTDGGLSATNEWWEQKIRQSKTWDLIRKELSKAQNMCSIVCNDLCMLLDTKWMGKLTQQPSPVCKHFSASSVVEMRAELGNFEFVITSSLDCSAMSHHHHRSPTCVRTENPWATTDFWKHTAFTHNDVNWAALCRKGRTLSVMRSSNHICKIFSELYSVT